MTSTESVIPTMNHLCH